MPKKVQSKMTNSLFERKISQELINGWLDDISTARCDVCFTPIPIKIWLFMLLCGKLFHCSKFPTQIMSVRFKCPSQAEHMPHGLYNSLQISHQSILETICFRISRRWPHRVLYLASYCFFSTFWIDFTQCELVQRCMEN